MSLITVNIYADDEHHHHKRKLRWRIGPVTEQLIGPPTEVPMDLTLTDSQDCVLSVEVDDKKGFPTADPNAISWASSDPSVAVVTQDPANPQSASISAVKPGTVQVTATDGTLTAIGNVTIVAGAAASLGMSAGTPTEQP